MTTLFLPGYSLQNKQWLEETVAQLPQISFTPIHWAHWQTGESDISSFNFPQEVSRLVSQATGPVNILAKSIGTVVSAKAINSHQLSIHKVVFCGLPFKNVVDTQNEIITMLANFDPQNILFIQNTQDPAGPASELIKWLPKQYQLITPESDLHHYPYPQLFSQFLL